MSLILIADDEASIRTIVSRALEKQGHEIIRAQTGQEAFDYLKTRPIDVALLDIRMPDMTGLEILSRREEFPSSPHLFIITAQDTMENAVEAMKRGAYDYLTKPFDLDELSILVSRALETRKLQKEVETLKSEATSRSRSQATIVGKSKGIQEIYKTIGKVADQDVTVLIEGESGTGKEMVAKAIHFQGRRAPYPFVAVNCSAIPSNLLESELFGYKKGAFTGAMTDKIGYFERAHLGTLFLDEIGDMPLPLQAKILRVLQEREIQRVGDTRTVSVDVRIIAATNQNLAGRVQKGQFREDLFFRLNVVPIQIPSLRERKNDIHLLVDYFLQKNAEDFKVDPKRLSADALTYLEEQRWPGNIRELENLIKRVFVLTSGSVLEAHHFRTLASASTETARPKSADPVALEGIIDDSLKGYFEKMTDGGETDLYNRFIPLMERPLIKLTLKKTKGNQLKAAILLGINRNTLRKRIRELEISFTDIKK